MLYREDGMILDVEILEDNSDKEWERYKLKVINVIRSGMFKPAEIGEIFTCDKQRNVACGGMWDLDN